MDTKNLFILRYKVGSTGVVTAYVTASNLAKAIEVGRWYCGQSPSWKFLQVIPAVVATEEDLKYASVEDRDNAATKAAEKAADEAADRKAKADRERKEKEEKEKTEKARKEQEEADKAAAKK